MSSQGKNVEIICPVCQARFEVKQAPGEAADCPQCGQLLEVPGPSKLAVGLSRWRQALGAWWVRRQEQKKHRRKERAEERERTPGKPACVETEKEVARAKPEGPVLIRPNLFPCPDCGQQVSRNATACPNCGRVLANHHRQPSTPVRDAPPSPANTAEAMLLTTRPAMFKNNPISWVFCGVLCLVGIGFIVLLYEWFRCKYTRFTVTDKRIVLRTGCFSRSTSEVRHKDVRNIRVMQGFFDRLFDVGKLTVSSAGTSGVEISVSGIPSPNQAADLIRQHQD